MTTTIDRKLETSGSERHNSARRRWVLAGAGILAAVAGAAGIALGIDGTATASDPARFDVTGDPLYARFADPSPAVPGTVDVTGDPLYVRFADPSPAVPDTVDVTADPLYVRYGDH